MISQAEFAKKNNVEFPLLSDPDGSVAKKYGVQRGDRPMAQRVTFIIDEKGILRHIDREVSVRSHGGDLAKIIADLRS